MDLADKFGNMVFLVLLNAKIIVTHFGMDKDLKSTDAQNVGARIAAHRRALGLSQEAFAQRAGLNRSQLANWERTGRIPMDGAVKLAREYDLSLDFLCMGRSGDGS